MAFSGFLKIQLIPFFGLFFFKILVTLLVLGHAPVSWAFTSTSGKYLGKIFSFFENGDFGLFSGPKSKEYF